MSDLADVLWQQFGTEVGEHLDVVESELAKGEQGDVAGLFRAFHSIKGLAAAMGVQAMEGIAHSGESLLAGVRDAIVRLDDEHCALLTDLGDCLRAMSEEAVAVRGDVAQREAIAKRLDVAVAAFRSGGAPTPDDGAAQDAQNGDARMTALGRALAQTMDKLVAALRPGAPGDALARLDEDLLALDGQVGDLGLQGLRRQIRHLSRVVHAGRPDVGLLHDLALALSVIEELTGRDAGGRALRVQVAQSGAGDLIRCCARASEALRTTLPLQGHSTEVADLLEAAVLRADLLGLARSGILLRLAIDLLRRGRLHDDANATLSGVLDRIVEQAAANPPGDIEEQQAGRLEEMLRALVDEKGVEATVARARALGVGSALLQEMSDEAREHLEHVIDDPSLILVEIDADLESDGVMAKAFAAWVADNADPVTSIVEGGEAGARTRLLIATPARPAALRADLRALDRGGENLHFSICDGSRMRERRTDRTDQPLPDETLRVPARVIDDILERLGELMPVAAGLEALVRTPALLPRERDALLHTSQDTAGLSAVVDRADDRHDTLRSVSDTFARTLKGLREAAMELRIVPVELLFSRYPRLVREMARQQEKQVALAIEANGARIDKGMIERLADPLMHMIRNAVDHGIEAAAEREATGKAAQGRLVLRAEQRGEHVTIELIDDGRGIDTARVRERALARGLLTRETAARAGEEELQRLIFEPGFSTAEAVTATSGRGVGMDVVATTVAGLGGSLRLESHRGEGTRVTLELPLSVALQSTLLVEQSGQVFALPDRHVTAVAHHHGSLVGPGDTPLAALAELLGLAPSAGGNSQVVMIVAGARHLALTVDRVIRRADVLVKESHTAISAVPGLSGASRLGDGTIVVLLDPDGLIGLAREGRPV